MRIVVTGASGLLGWRVVDVALRRGHEVYSIYNTHRPRAGMEIRLDITDREGVRSVIRRLRPDAIIHTAAYTDVDGCEVNRDVAWRVNAEATRYIAEVSAEVGSHMVYISTDYVFDGLRGLYREDDKPNPINYYGYTKLMGEEYVMRYAGSWCIARTSVVYGWGGYKQNFATWIIENLRHGKQVRVLIDQYVSPTLNTNLAQMLVEIAERRISGIIHTAGANRVSRYEFARKLAEVFGLDQSLIIPARMDEMRWRARRPRDSSLDVSRASRILREFKPMTIDEALNAMRIEENILVVHSNDNISLWT